MTRVLVLGSGQECLPALGVLPFVTTVAPPDLSAAVAAPPGDVVIVDGTDDVGRARTLAAAVTAAGLGPVLVVLDDGGMAAVGPDWAGYDIVHVGAGPAEVRARVGRAQGDATGTAGESSAGIALGALEIDEEAWAARIHGRALNLTYKEFELLRYLAAHPGRVCTRDDLLTEVWGADYFGGVRTVDVHVRRLRAKLGDHDALIETVRGVGYRANRPHQ